MLVVVAEVAEEEKMLSTFNVVYFDNLLIPDERVNPCRRPRPSSNDIIVIVDHNLRGNRRSSSLFATWIHVTKCLTANDIWRRRHWFVGACNKWLWSLNSGPQSNFRRIDNAYKTSYYRLNRCCGTVHAAWIAAVTLSVPRSKRLMY